MENNEALDVDYLLELDNGDIVQDVKSNKNKFSWQTLCKFSEVVEQTLSLNEVYDIIDADEVSASYFKNYIDVRIPDQRRIREDRELGPIPQFYHLPSKMSNILRLADAESAYLVIPKDHYYTLYFAFKLALIPSGSFFSLLDYQKRYFEDQDTYLKKLQFLAADFSDILGERQLILQKYIDGQSIEILNPSDEDTETIHNVQHRQQVIAIMAILNHLLKDVENRPNNTTITKFVMFLTGKNPGKRIQDTNTYKWVSRPLVPKNEERNVVNLSKVRQHFENLMLTSIASSLTTEINKSNF